MELSQFAIATGFSTSLSPLAFTNPKGSGYSDRLSQEIQDRTTNVELNPARIPRYHAEYSLQISVLDFRAIKFGVKRLSC